MGRIQTKRGLGCWQVQFVSYCKKVNNSVMGLGAGDEALGKFCNLYPHLYLEAVFPIDTKLLPNKHFCLKAGNLIISFAPPLLGNMSY